MSYNWVQYTQTANLKDGVYNCLYNKEPAVCRIRDGLPVFIQFINYSAIYDARGILHSSVEILLPES